MFYSFINLSPVLKTFNVNTKKRVLNPEMCLKRISVTTVYILDLAPNKTEQ